jgi:hypothetical protein
VSTLGEVPVSSFPKLITIYVVNVFCQLSLGDAETGPHVLCYTKIVTGLEVGCALYLCFGFRNLKLFSRIWKVDSPNRSYISCIANYFRFPF